MPAYGPNSIEVADFLVQLQTLSPDAWASAYQARVRLREYAGFRSSFRTVIKLVAAKQREDSEIADATAAVDAAIKEVVAGAVDRGVASGIWTSDSAPILKRELSEVAGSVGAYLVCRDFIYHQDFDVLTSPFSSAEIHFVAAIDRPWTDDQFRNAPAHWQG